VIFIAALLRKRDPGVLISQAHVQGRAACADGERPITQLSGEIKRLSCRLLVRHAQRIVSHLRLDALSHEACGAEVPVCRR
jgi:hypothetical protein